MARLDGRVCVVTGATGMAEAAALRIGAEGGKVFVVSRTAETAASLATAVEAAGGDAAFQPTDPRDAAATEAAFAACVERFGRVDGLFAVAGGSARRAGDGPAHEAPLEGFEAAFDWNAVPAYLAARGAVRAMLDQEPLPTGERGSIVLMSSVLATSPGTDVRHSRLRRFQGCDQLADNDDGGVLRRSRHPRQHGGPGPRRHAHVGAGAGRSEQRCVHRPANNRWPAASFPPSRSATWPSSCSRPSRATSPVR